jgi:hypothetical protein
MNDYYDFTDSYQDSLRYVAERASSVRELKEPILCDMVYKDKIKDMVERDDDISDFIFDNLIDECFKKDFKIFLELQINKNKRIRRKLDTYIEKDIEITMSYLCNEEPTTNWHFKETEEEKWPI